MVNEIASYQGDVSFMVPPNVNAKLISKYKNAGGKE